MSSGKRPFPFMSPVYLDHQKKGGLSKMRKNLTELVMILDRSGSMGGLESDTIGGYNSMHRKRVTKKGGEA